MTFEAKSRSAKPRSLTGEQIRSAFLDFFAQRDHRVIPSASLVPEDPTVLLTIAGMLPFKPVFLGQIDRPAARATSSQKCIRTNDIENVGRTARHHTFFEMLGNFSFGDYFKKEAIQWAWELSIDVFGLDPKNLVVSVFREDQESESIWRNEVGVDPKRIIRMGETDNFWSSGPTGPCGPCSEIYYDFHPELGDEGIDLEDDSRFIEFYNLVFMQYNRDQKGNLTPLANCNIDTGMGLERMAQILQAVPNNYETDLIYPLLQQVANLANVDYKFIDHTLQTSIKVIGDHSRAVTHLIADGVTASNLGRGYILRRLIRRMVRHGRLLGIGKPFLVDMGKSVIDLMGCSFPDLIKRQKIILQELEREESRFLETLDRGEKLLSELLAKYPKQISGKQAFELYDTYGFPVELTQEIAQEHGLDIDLKGFDKAMEEQRQRAKAATISIDLTLKDTIDEIVTSQSQTSFRGYDTLEQNSEIKALIVNGEVSNAGQSGDQIQIVLDKTPFYAEGGGQIADRGILFGDGVNIVIENVTRNRNVFVHRGCVKSGFVSIGDVLTCIVDRSSRLRAQANHTATHLLQSALKRVVDPSIVQAGSLVDFDHLRFDFHSSRLITPVELKKIEELVNQWISESHVLDIKEMRIEKAKDLGAIAMFGEKYDDIVRVVDVPSISMELCGGTHVKNTIEIGLFKIILETGIASGIRRIEAITSNAILTYINERDEIIKQLSNRFKSQPSEIFSRVVTIQEELKEANKALAISTQELALSKANNLLHHVKTIGKNKCLVSRLDGVDGNALQKAAQSLLDNLGDQAAVVLGGLPTPTDNTKVILVAAFGKELFPLGLQAGKFIGGIAKLCGGGGGGRPNLAQAGGRDGKALNFALESAREQLISFLA